MENFEAMSEVLVKVPQLSESVSEASVLEWRVAEGDLVAVDDVLVDPAMYTAVNGSTIVTLKPEYLESLSLGLHTLTFVYNNGKTSTYFTILAAGADEPDHTHEVTLVPETAPTCTASGSRNFPSRSTYFPMVNMGKK